jgi:hypothetical protein
MRQLLHTLSRHPLLLAGCALLATLGAAALIAHLVDADLRQQSRLMNVSCRGPAGTGPDAMLVGFVVNDRPQTLVVRARGESPGGAGNAAGLSEIVLRVVRNADGVDVGRNEQWRAPGNERLQGDLRHLAPAQAKDAACVLRLAPGAYSALVEPKGGQKGMAGIEIFVVKE